MLDGLLYFLFNLGSSFGFVIILILILMSAIKIVPEYQRIVVFRLGRLIGAKGPGLVIVIPVVDRVIRVDLRIVTLDVPVQEVITKDNVPIKVNAVVYFRVMDPANSVIEVENYMLATSQLSQTTLRSVIGGAELDEVLSSREKINSELQKIIDERTDSWGIKVSAVEVKELELPEGMKRAMAKQAEAERERRAKIINAEGELQAAKTLLTMIEKDEIELAFFGHNPLLSPSSTLTMQSLGRSSFALIAPPDHPWAQWKIISPAQLLEENFISYSKDTAHYCFVNDFFLNNKLKTPRLTQVDNEELLLQLVTQGFGIGIAMEIAVRKEVKQKEVIILSLQNLAGISREIFLAHSTIKGLTYAGWEMGKVAEQITFDFLNQG